MNKYISDAAGAPGAIGPYSLAVVSGDLAFLSGQIGFCPETGNMADGVEAQTGQVMKNLAAVLAAAGCSFSDVVRSTIYLADLADFETVNRIYEEALGGFKPARATVQAAALPKGALVEIDMIARVP